MRYVSKVSDNIYRGPRPYSYGELKDQLPNVSVVISLQSGIQNWFSHTPYEVTSPRDAGIRRDSFALTDWGIPSAEHLITIAKDIQAYARDGQTVYIHCKHGVDRTGMVVATYRMLNGIPYELAIEEMYKRGFHKWPYLYWIPALKKVSKLLKANVKI